MESRDQRDARVHARPGQGQGQGQRRPQRRQVQRREADLRRHGGPAHRDDRESRRSRRRGRQCGRHRRHGLQRPDLLGHGTAGPAPARATTRSTTVKTRNYGVDKTDHQDAEGARRGQQARTSRCWSTSRSRPTSSPRSSRRSPPPPASTRRAATRSPPRSWRSPSRRRPRPARCPTTLLGPLKWVGLGLAALLFLFFMTRGMKQAREREPGTPALADRDRGAGLAGAARGGRTASGFTLDQASTRCCPRAPRTPA